MSLSKASEQPLGPKCNRCRHHGIIARLKGHAKRCPFLGCSCWKCNLITQRTQIMTLQRGTKAQSRSRGPVREGTLDASAADAGAPQPSTPGHQPGETPGPLDLRTMPAAGGDGVIARGGGGLLLPSRKRILHSPFPVEFGRIAPRPLIHFPMSMPGYMPCSNFLLNIPWPPPVPVFPHFHPLALHYPAAPQAAPAADYRNVCCALQTPPYPEALQEAVASGQHPEPLPPNTEESAGD